MTVTDSESADSDPRRTRTRPGSESAAGVSEADSEPGEPETGLLVTRDA